MTQHDILIALRNERLRTEQLLKESSERLHTDVRNIISPEEKENSRQNNIMSWVNRGLSIYEGIRIGLTVINACQSIFGHKKKRRR